MSTYPKTHLSRARLRYRTVKATNQKEIDQFRARIGLLPGRSDMDLCRFAYRSA